jgi:hypothetical protein
MHTWKVGDKSRAICEPCGEIVDTTFCHRDVPFQRGYPIVKGILVATCDECDKVVSIPPQSMSSIRAAKEEALGVSGPASAKQNAIAICGSMAFMNEMEALAVTIRSFGIDALTPQREEVGLDCSKLSRAETVRLKRRYVDTHLEKIRRSGAVLIANFDKRGVAGYVGPNTLMEAAFAHALGVPVIFLNDPSKQSCGLECLAIARECLDGEVSGAFVFNQVLQG